MDTEFRRDEKGGSCRPLPIFLFFKFNHGIWVDSGILPNSALLFLNLTEQNGRRASSWNLNGWTHC